MKVRIFWAAATIWMMTGLMPVERGVLGGALDFPALIPVDPDADADIVLEWNVSYITKSPLGKPQQVSQSVSTALLVGHVHLQVYNIYNKVRKQ